MNRKRKPSRWPYQLVTPHFEIRTNKRGIAWLLALVGQRWHTGDHRENFDEMAHYPVKMVKIHKVPRHRLAKRSAIQL